MKSSDKGKKLFWNKSLPHKTYSCEGIECQLLLLVITTLLMRWILIRDGVRRSRNRSRLWNMGIVVWPLPPRICWLAILVVRWRLLRRLWVRRVGTSTWWGSGRGMVRRGWWLLWGIVHGMGLGMRLRMGRSVTTNGRLIMRWLVIRLWRANIGLWRLRPLCVGSYWGIAIVIATRCVFSVLKTEAGHLSLDIFHHFTALNVSCHHKITALLLHIGDCILAKKSWSTSRHKKTNKRSLSISFFRMSNWTSVHSYDLLNIYVTEKSSTMADGMYNSLMEDQVKNVGYFLPEELHKTLIPHWCSPWFLCTWLLQLEFVCSIFHGMLQQIERKGMKPEGKKQNIVI